ncbi:MULTISPECIES: FtsX-like permease family protein [Kitasatospora]|uniref:Putative membrane protein n=1 Tax=Kitasatospora setae (strain ATCC 33774 / DSM 43861 / JCM 3304 / KCC A-0304 / NBRC 14216 / KM-6054) TaxID=452652 RepID=E4N1X7_KITSK|nr:MULTISPECIES: FtsX-like permease family protein [Kitasatospora]BAJ32161.1 putative membrane protein [Kitasatospora setae KM-6054]
MIRLGLRLAVSGGREALLRLLVTAAAVAIGVGLLFTTLAAVNAVHAQNSRYAWTNSGFSAATQAGPADREAAEPGAAGPTATGPDADGNAPLWWLARRDSFQGREIGRIDVAATGPTGALPPGVDRLPADGEYYLSPALAKLADAAPPEQLADRFGGHRIGILGKEALPGPDSLVALVGGTPQEVSQVHGAVRVARILTTPPDRCDDCVVGIQSNGVTLILTVVAGALVFPLLILIGTATRLSATQRERRFAAMRLVGATPRQVAAVSAVEAAVSAAAGALLGFLPYLAVRGRVAGLSLTTERFYASDLTLTLPQIAVLLLGVPLAAVVAARIALRRVQVSPLGVSRRVTPKPPRAWRVAPLLAGLAELVFLLVRHPESVPGQVRGYLSAFGLIMIGIVLAGPWLTGRAAALLARRTQRPATLIAVRRLADNPTAGFRAVSGLVLALLVMTATIGIITTMTDERGRVEGGSQFDNVLLNHLSDGRTPEGLDRGSGPPAPPGLTTGLLAVPGVRATMLVHPLDHVVPVQVGEETTASEVVACSELDAVAVFGHCEPGAATAYLPSVLAGFRDHSGTAWPAAPHTAEQLAALPVVNVVVATDGSPAAVERARTMVDAAYPAVRQAHTLSEGRKLSGSELEGFQQLARVVILATFPIAGCSLAVSVAAALGERKRPFSLLRLSGVSLAMLRRVVLMESAVPLLAVSALAIGTGLLAADLFLRSQLHYTLHSLGTGYYLAVAGGLAGALAVIGATLPLLRRITGPEAARNE